MVENNGNEKILVVDDAVTMLDVLKRNLTAVGYCVFTAASVEEAIRLLEDTHVDLVVTDLKMPGPSGLDLVRHVRENLKDTEVMMITGYPSVEGAVMAVKSGAEDYLPKPFTDEELLDAVRRSLNKLQRRRITEGPVPKKPFRLHGLLGESQAMKNVYRSIEKASATLATVLITGESGTGKELVARAIHYNSTQAAGSFVPVSCAGIPEGLLESELFGHVKGAFTGATDTRAGFFQTAEGGSIFLDEISEISPSTQVKLLRVLQDKEICMVGTARPRKVDVRILAATNKDIFGLVKNGKFREDLFYRLNVITINVPALRERKDDILLLATEFARKFAGELGKPIPRFSDDALNVLTNYNWPGNVRELENVIQRLVVMTDGDVVDLPDLPSLMRFSALRNQGLNRTLAEVEAEYIKNVLTSVHGNKTHAAQILNIDRKTLREKIKLYSLEDTSALVGK